ncbi:hypothetical protein [Erythrobacter sp. EC-HK427]|uniref:hypothetical protein n=1 Tax=Erythrobacter sp. EC-HK427 TaxID=2038396 RepID=UPI00125A930F|nr:hypothetical protein [Erythrobacter sp. EC-HK427]VVS96809.1 conserved hypothetical protein [Erythrobacter sp. EC-HK427]
MSFPAALVLIVLIIGVCSVMMERTRNRTLQGRSLEEQERRALEAERDDARQELDQIKERVKVLERIATDPARRTAEEIEKLRDE